MPEGPYVRISDDLRGSGYYNGKYGTIHCKTDDGPVNASYAVRLDRHGERFFFRREFDYVSQIEYFAQQVLDA